MTTNRYSLNIFDDQGMTMIHLVDSLSDPSTSEDIFSVSLSFLGSSYSRGDFQLNAVSVAGLTVDYFKSDGSQAMYDDTFAYMTITKTDGGSLLDNIADGEGTHLMRMDNPALMDAFDVNASTYNTNDGEVSFGGDSGGTKPMVTFENLQEDASSGNLSFDVWLNQLPDRAEIANLSQIYFQGNFNSNATPLVWEQNTIFDATSGIEFSSPSDASESIPNFGLGNDSNSIADVLWAAGLMTNDLQLISPVKLGTFNTLMFTDSFTYLGSPTDSGDPSLWEIGDLGLGDGGTYGLTNVMLKGLTASPDYLPVQKELNLFDILNYSPSDGGGEGPTAPSGPEYTHIGNSSGGTSGIDTSNSDYSPSTGVVEFNIIGDSLVVDTATLYHDNGGDASGTPSTMGVYLDMGLGLASSLVPSENTITTPEAAQIVEQVYTATEEIFVDSPYINGTAIHLPIYIDAASTIDISEFTTDYFALQMENMPLLSQYLIDNMPGENNSDGYMALDGTTQFVAGNYRVAELGHDLYVGFAPAGDGKFYLQLFDANYTYSPDDLITNLVEPGENFIGEIVLDDGYIGEASMYAEFFALTTPEAWDSALGTFFWDMDNIQTAPVGVGSVQKSVVSTLDATESNVNALPWGISLTDYDDVFIGRDDKDNGDGTYTTTVEVVAASLGNDTIDGGGGYNSAYFGHIGTDHFNPMDPVNLVSFDMNSGEVSISTSTNSYQQNWHGFQEFIGSAAQDFVIGTGENDPSIIDDIFTLTVGENVITNNTGSNVMISNGGGGTFYGNGGTDIIFLNDDGLIDPVYGNLNYGYAYGGSGADVIAFGLGEDDVYGDGGEYYGYSSSSGMSSSGSSMSEMDSTDDFYNDEVTFAMFDIDEHGGSGLTPPTGTITFNTGSQSFSFDLAAGASWDDFVNEANKQMNLDLGNLVDDGSGNVTVADGRTAYAYFVRETVDVYDTVANDGSTIAATSELKIYYGEGLVAPDIAGYHVPDTNESYDPTLYPAGAPSATFVDPDHGGTATYAADMFAPTMRFIEGTGDDNDIFSATEFSFPSNLFMHEENQGLAAINNDTIYDLDIGQNSLSLAADRGESIYFETGLIDQGATQINVSYDDVTSLGKYLADVTLTDVNGNTASFTLDNLNGPTTALYGEQTYQLAAVWEDVAFSNVGLDEGVGNTWSDTSKSSVTELRFEWQGLGEKVGSDAVDMLTGSNGSNTFQAYGEDDVLNGAGGGDTYQFTGIFGNDKVLDFGNTGTDILQIGASSENVWFERLGRRGDELKITVNDGTHMGTISVGRQYNPYSSMQAVEQIHFGFDGTTAQDIATIGNGMHGGDIKVLKDGEEHFHLHGDSGSVIYMNQNEGAATVSISWRDTWSDTWDASNPMYFDNIGLEIDYDGNDYEDEFFIELETDANGDYVAGGTGALHSLLSKSGINVVHQDGNQGINVESSVNSEGYTEYQFTDADSGALLFALETINAASWGA